MNDEALVKLRAAQESSLCIFAQDLLGAALSPWQRELLVEVVNNPHGLVSNTRITRVRETPRDMEQALARALEGSPAVAAQLDQLVAAAIERSPMFKALRALLDSKPTRIVAQEEFTLLKTAEAQAEGRIIGSYDSDVNALHAPKSVAQMKSEAGAMTHPGGKLPVDCPVMAASVSAPSGLLGALQNGPIYEVAIDPAAVPNGDQSVMRIVNGIPPHAGEVSVKINRHPAPQGINKVR